MHSSQEIQADLNCIKDTYLRGEDKGQASITHQLSEGTHTHLKREIQNSLNLSQLNLLFQGLKTPPVSISGGTVLLQACFAYIFFAFTFLFEY